MNFGHRLMTRFDHDMLPTLINGTVILLPWEIMFLDLDLRKAYLVEPARRSCGAVVQVMKLNGATPATSDMAAVGYFSPNEWS